MNRSSASSSRHAPRSAGSRAKCGCGLPLLIYTSETDDNPGRRFLRCRNWQVSKAIFPVMFFKLLQVFHYFDFNTYHLYFHILMLPVNCDFFFWIDAAGKIMRVDGTAGKIVRNTEGVDDTRSINNESINSAISAQTTVDCKRKIKKLKRKLDDETFQKNVACGVAVLSLIVAIWSSCVGMGST